MNKSIAAAFAILLLAGIPAVAQTTAELLQKGIFAQETEGNLDNAILIYRQIVNSAPTQRDLAAQAQYRLAQALLQKGDLATAAKEFETLARNYSDYGNLVSSLAGQMRPAPAGGRGGRGPASAELAQALDQVAALEKQKARIAELQARLAELRTRYSDGHPDIVRLEQQIDDLKKSGSTLTAQSQALFAAEFDNSKPITLTGTVSQALWVNPRSWLKLDTASGTYTIMLAAPNTMIRTGKMTRGSFPLGDTLTVTGVLAKDGSQTVRGDTITAGGNIIFDRATLAQQ